MKRTITLVATGSYGTQQQTVTFPESSILPNMSIRLSVGNVIIDTIDLGISVQSVATFRYTGTGVTTTVDGGTTTLTHVDYADGYDNILRDKTNGQTTSGGLLLLNKTELLTLLPQVPGSTTSFMVNQT